MKTSAYRQTFVPPLYRLDAHCVKGDVGHGAPFLRPRPVPFGHLGYWFPDVGHGTLSGYYQALRPGLTQNRTAAQLFALGDQAALLHIREFADLFIVGDVP